MFIHVGRIIEEYEEIVANFTQVGNLQGHSSGACWLGMRLAGPRIGVRIPMCSIFDREHIDLGDRNDRRGQLRLSAQVI